MMARRIPTICCSNPYLRNSLFGLSKIRQCPSANFNPHLENYCQKRSLFSDEALSMNGFLQQRRLLQKQYPGEQINEFFEAMDKNIFGDNSGSGMVFMQDLKNAIYLSNNDSKNLSVLTEMLKRYCEQKSTTRFGRFAFGPILMRLYYHLNSPVTALEVLESSHCRNLFNEPASYQIALCLLYKNELYTEILDLVDKIIKERLAGMNHPKNCVLLGLAAVLKLDNEESYQRGLALVDKSLGNTGTTAGMHRRLLCLAVCVALKANCPDQALKLLGNNPWHSFPTIRNATVLAWLQKGDMKETLSVMRRASSAERFKNDQNFIYQHVYDAVVDAVTKSKQPELKEELKVIERGLVDGNMLSKENLFEVVLQPMNSLTPSKNTSEKFNQGAFKRFERERNQKRVSSLMDTMEG